MLNACEHRCLSQEGRAAVFLLLLQKVKDFIICVPIKRLRALLKGASRSNADPLFVVV